MDSFILVRKAPSLLTNGKGPGAHRKLEETTSKRQYLHARRRYAPYPTEERIQRIQRALNDAGGEGNTVLHVSPVSDDLVLDSSNNSEPPKHSPFSEAGAYTRHTSQNARSEHCDKAGPAIKREHVLDMKHRLNPITHSDAPRKSQNFVSCSNGHQSGRIGASAQVFREIDTRLANQASTALSGHRSDPSETPRSILRGLRIYVDGLVRGTTRSELVRLVTIHGGHNLRVANSATHVITSTGLSGIKSQRCLDASFKKKANLHVVKPEWLLDSINAGKRLKEYKYRIVKSEVQDEIHLPH